MPLVQIPSDTQYCSFLKQSHIKFSNEFMMIFIVGPVHTHYSPAYDYAEGRSSRLFRSTSSIDKFAAWRCGGPSVLLHATRLAFYYYFRLNQFSRDNEKKQDDVCAMTIWWSIPTICVLYMYVFVIVWAISETRKMQLYIYCAHICRFFSERTRGDRSIIQRDLGCVVLCAIAHHELGPDRSTYRTSSWCWPMCVIMCILPGTSFTKKNGIFL